MRSVVTNGLVRSEFLKNLFCGMRVWILLETCLVEQSGFIHTVRSIMTEVSMPWGCLLRELGEARGKSQLLGLADSCSQCP